MFSLTKGTLSVQLSKIVLITLLDDLPLELEGSGDKTRLGGPWLRYQLDPGRDLKLLQPRLLTSLKNNLEQQHNTINHTCNGSQTTENSIRVQEKHGPLPTTVELL